MLAKRLAEQRTRTLARSRRPRLQIEQLEERWLPAPLTYLAMSGNGLDDMVLRTDGTNLLLYNNSMLVANPLLADTDSVAITGASGEEDRLTIDYATGGFFALANGIAFSNEPGVAGTDSLRVMGDNVISGSYTPSGTAPGSGALTAGGTAITISGVEDVATSGLVGVTFTTPNSADTLTVDSPSTGQNRIAGTSDGVSFAPLTFSAVTSVTLDTAANDGAGTGIDSVLVSAGESATGLMNFTLNTGTGNDAVTVDRPFVLSVPGGTFQVDEGVGNDALTVNATTGADSVDLTSNAVTINGNSVQFSNVETLTVNTLIGADAVTMASINPTTATTVDVGVDADFDGYSGNLASDFAGTLTLVHFDDVRLHVGGNFSGSWTVMGSGTINDLGVDGSITSMGMIMAEDIINIMVMGNMAGTVTASGPPGTGNIGTVSVGGSFTGQINASGTLGTLSVSGSSTGTVVAAVIGLITIVDAMAGSPVLQVTQAGVLRQLVTTRVDNGMPTPSSVRFTAVYDGTTPGAPQLAIKVRNGSTSTSTDDIRFDLGLVTSTAAKWNLALLYADGTSGIRNVAIEGDLLATVSPAALAFLGLPSTTPGGVRLPLDALGGVTAQGNVRAGTVRVASLQAVAFGSITIGSTTTPGQLATHVQAAQLLAAGSLTVLANDTYKVHFSEPQPVAFFLDTGPGTFDNKNILFTDQMTNNASVTVLVTAAAGNVMTVQFQGDGGSLRTSLPIRTAITSTGPLGDLTLSSSYGIANVTAPSIFGNLDTNGPIFGTVQTTVGDLGRTITNLAGTITGITTINVNGEITGRVISRGNLVSSIQSHKIHGVIAAQGDIGAIQRNGTGAAVLDSAGRLIRWGGITANGGIYGEIVALGNVFGDIRANGGLKDDGRIAVKGRAVAGLASTRMGILGNVIINGTIHRDAALVSGGLISDVASGTTLSLGNNHGIIAAKGDINWAHSPRGTVFENATGANAAAINAIFTQGGLPLAFDLVGLDLAGLALILNDLAALRVGSGGSLTGPVA